jgi:hypothetical protein
MISPTILSFVFAVTNAALQTNYTVGERYDATCVPVFANGQEIPVTQRKAKAFLIRVQLDHDSAPKISSGWTVYSIKNFQTAGNVGYFFAPDLAGSRAEFVPDFDKPSLTFRQSIGADDETTLNITTGIDGRSMFRVIKVADYPEWMIAGTCAVRPSPLQQKSVAK